ncbi:MYXO-CTERM sorting domain-containing protein [Nannocystis punicea]|uniref:MYXO-CTERM domain-containing protein n=1 Tax=Nannocystis punicea TaxID=2995304 RepID=A0ABY7H6I3_9BACT|nr:MYXO-CTERM sorting domain-containing protein [Nannocystis poenicansa]WAS94890.1 hypothetical protein O0S08_01905 [Nannocystis poenicansa]
MHLRRWSLACFLLVPATARADVPPPPSFASCQGASQGEACQLDAGGSGRCAPATCSKLDYSQGSPPRSVEYDCLRCAAQAAAGDAKVSGSTPATSAESQPPAVKQGCNVDPTAGMLGVLVALAGLRRRRHAVGSM